MPGKFRQAIALVTNHVEQEHPFMSADRVLLGLLFLLVLGFSFWDKSFTSSQKTQIENIIKEYLIANPEVLSEALYELKQRSIAAEQGALKNNIAGSASLLYKSKLSYVAGNRQGDVTLVEFFDYNCGFCKRAFKDVLSILETDKNLRFIVKEFPILGPGSVFASKAAIASKAQGKYWDFHIALMKTRGKLDEAKVMSTAASLGLDTEKLRRDMDMPAVVMEIEEAYDLAERLGIKGTPAFVVDDELLRGAVGQQTLKKEITAVRNSGGCKIC